MTYETVVGAGEPAFNQLPNGAFVRYEPKGRVVQVLSHPGFLSEWRGAAVWDGPVPDAGWKHRADCGCRHCAAQSASIDQRVSQRL